MHYMVLTPSAFLVCVPEYAGVTSLKAYTAIEPQFTLVDFPHTFFLNKVEKCSKTTGIPSVPLNALL